MVVHFGVAAEMVGFGINLQRATWKEEAVTMCIQLNHL